MEAGPISIKINKKNLKYKNEKRKQESIEDVGRRRIGQMERKINKEQNGIGTNIIKNK